MSDNTKDERISIRVDRELYNTIARIAHSMGVGVSTAARVLLKQSVDREIVVNPSEQKSDQQQEKR